MKQIKNIWLSNEVIKDARNLPELAGTVNGAELLGVSLQTADHIICSNRYVAALQIIQVLMKKYPKLFQSELSK